MTSAGLGCAFQRSMRGVDFTALETGLRHAAQHPGIDCILATFLKEMPREHMHEFDFEAVIAETLAALPEWVRQAMQNVSVLIEDVAGDHLDPDGEGLLGLYTGIPLTERESGNAGELPDVIYLFRRPHLELGLTADELREEIAKTLIHEIAHYFGIDDDHLDDIGWG